MKYISFFIWFLLLIGCSDAVKIDDSKVFRLNRYDNISSLDPAFARNQSNNWVCNLLYNGLVRIDDDLNIQADIAKKWSISEDGKTYSFLLRKDVYFHKNIVFGKDSTRNVVASDFVYSFDRLIDPQIGGAGSWIMNNIASYDAVNDSVLHIQLKEAFPPFLGLLSMKYCSVLPKEAFANGQDIFQKHPIGTGPFHFKLWEDNVKLVLRKNNLYFEKDEKGNRLPYLEAISIRFLPEKHSEFLELIKGDMDILSDLDPSYKDEILTPLGDLNPKYQDRIQLIKAPYLSTVYLCFYLEGEEVIDQRLRQAMNYGIDKEKIVKYMMNGMGTAATAGFIPKGLPGHTTKAGYKHDTKKAITLINAYKEEKGNLPKIKLTTVQEYTAICEYIQAEMAKLGLNLEIDVVPGATLRDGRATGKFTFFRANWGADYPDAENFLSLFYSKNFSPEGPNYSHFKSEAYDKLYEQSFYISDPAKRLVYYEEMDQLAMKSSPIIPLFYDQSTIFLNKKVKGFTMSPIKLLDLTRVYKEK